MTNSHRGHMGRSARSAVLWLLALLADHDWPAAEARDRGLVYVPAVNPATRNVDFYEVSSRHLVLDPYRNPVLNVTVNSYADFVRFPNASGTHFIPIDDTGHGMALRGRGAIEINDEITRIHMQLPNDVGRSTFYQNKDPLRFPHGNVFTGPFSLTHPPPHQDFYRD